MNGALLIDGNSLMYRAYFALANVMMTDPEGTPTHALHGFLNMLCKVIAEERPAYVAVAFDLHGPTFRHMRYAEYKGTRPPTPDDLRPQFPLAKQALREMHIRILEKETFEADDLIGTASRMFAEQGIPALIVTGDRDSFQLTGPDVEVLYTKKGITETERITPAVIMERYGITPPQLIDMKALCGDTSDNIPGVPGIGEKTAAKLVAKYGDLETCLASADTQEKGRTRERLLENADLARECRFLAEIDRHVPMDFSCEEARLGTMTDGLGFLQEHGLRQVAKQLTALGELYGETVKPVAAAPADDVPGPAEEISSCGQLTEFADAIGADAVADILYDSAFFSLGCDGRAVTLPLGQASLLDAGVAFEDAVYAIRSLLESSTPKRIPNTKDFMRAAAACGVTVRGETEDPALAAYVLDPQRSSYTGTALLEQENIPISCGAAGLHALSARQSSALREAGGEDLLREIEAPLSRVLFKMEQAGFRADPDALETLGKQYAAELDRLNGEIRHIAGHDINVLSPKQLAALLYDEMGLDSGHKGAQARSTNADILEELVEAHPEAEIIGKILEYRKYAKLNGTYIEGLLKLLRAPGSDGRIRSRFDQTATATGRLSSNEPNLQNIPVRTELGREIRGAFTADPGCVLVDADYSQIELRVLAHMSGDENMIAAFRSGEDIHRSTAAGIYGVPIGEVTPAMRSAAKAVNFGIVYGISDFGLARNTGLARWQAAEFMAKYKQRYPRITEFMDACVEGAKRDGYTQTLSGRRRYIRELASGNRNVRMFGERAAMNSPIQGTAADIIKLAMIAVDRALEGMRARLILQVHDELIIECPEEEKDAVAALLKREMEAVMRLDAPLLAEVSVGRTWLECK